MRVHRMEVPACLDFSEQEKGILSPSFAFGDAEEQLSYAVHSFGSKRVTDLIVNAENSDIGVLALTEVDGFDDEDKKRIKGMCEAHGVKVVTCTCRWCGHKYEAEHNLLCRKCYKWQTENGQ